MAVYTEVTDEALRGFLADYPLGELLAFRGIAEGVENSNYAVKTEAGDFILTLNFILVLISNFILIFILNYILIPILIFILNYIHIHVLILNFILILIFIFIFLEGGLPPEWAFQQNLESSLHLWVNMQQTSPSVCLLPTHAARAWKQAQVGALLGVDKGSFRFLEGGRGS